jgi:CRISPR-associated protein Csb2
MIVAPVGDEAILEHLCQRLDGLRLKPEREQDLRGPVFLHRVRNDNVATFYTKDSNRWASVTPVILPGHDDHKPDKTRKLIEKALAQSGIDQPCTFVWSAFSHFPKSFSAHRYDKDKRPIGYIRPGHLQNLSAVHMCLTFEHPIPGPITLGAGRHCGFGLFAAPLGD